MSAPRRNVLSIADQFCKQVAKLGTVSSLFLLSVKYRFAIFYWQKVQLLLSRLAGVAAQQIEYTINVVGNKYLCILYGSYGYCEGYICNCLRLRRTPD